MIAIATDQMLPAADDARPVRIGSLRPIADILGDLLAGYQLAEPANPAAATAREAELVLAE